MDDLVRWLGEQLDTDAARAAQWHDLECEIHTHLDAGLLATVAASRMLTDVPGAVCDCGGPARVLREIDEKRKLLARYKELLADAKARGLVIDDVGEEYKYVILPSLAAGYSHRPGYAEAIATVE